MDLIVVLFWFVYLISTNPVTTNPTATTSLGAAITTTPLPASIIADATNPTAATTTSTTTAPLPSSIIANAVNTINILQNQLNQILVQFCASEIDRNKTASAILKFGQLSDAKASVTNVVEFHISNYEDSFDNLLTFISHISSFELQRTAYNTLVEAIKLNLVNVVNLLSFENFMRTEFLTKFELIDAAAADNIERQFYEDNLLIVGNHIKELIVATDLNKLIAFIKNSTNPDRIFELIPTIVQGVDLNNFTDMDRIFEFSMKLPRLNQLKLVRKVLAEMREKTRYRHVFHVILQIKLLRDLVSQKGTTEEKCLLLVVESEIPPQLNQLLSDSTRWQIKQFDAFLTYHHTPLYSKNLLFLNSDQSSNWWLFQSKTFNTVQIQNHHYNWNARYITVEYCFHGDSFPTVTERDDLDRTQDSWYLLMGDDLNYVQIKNIRTNELLIVDDNEEPTQGWVSRARVSLSVKCSDCFTSKWSLALESGEYSPDKMNCPSFS